MQVSTEQYVSTISFFTPLKLRRRGGHRMIVLPENSEDGINNTVEVHPGINEKLLKALVKAIVWERQLRSGKLTMRDLVQREGLSQRYIQRILQLTFLAPDLKEAILEGRQPEGLSVDALRFSMPLLWEEQRKRFRFYCKGQDEEKCTQ